MYCTHCGTQLPDTAVICYRCGRAAEPEQPGAQARPDGWYQPQESGEYRAYTAGPDVQDPPKKSRRGLWLGLGAAAAVLVVIGILFALFARGETASVGHADQQALVDDYFACFNAADEAGMKRLYPAVLQDYLEDEGYGGTSAFLTERDGWYDNYGAQALLWKVADAETYDPEEYDDIAQTLGVEIECAADVEVSVWFGAMQDDEESIVFDFDMLQIDGQWYLFSVW